MLGLGRHPLFGRAHLQRADDGLFELSDDELGHLVLDINDISRNCVVNAHNWSSGGGVRSCALSFEVQRLSGLFVLRPVEELGDELRYSFGGVFLEEVAGVGERGELGVGAEGLEAAHGVGDVGENSVFFAVDEAEGGL